MLMTGKESETMESILVTTDKKSGEVTMFESLWADEELTDVTLVCKDGSQLRAHKTVLET